MRYIPLPTISSRCPLQRGRGYEVNLSKPLMAAAAAGLASLIHALTAPLFNFIFGDNRTYFHRQAIKSGVSILATEAIFSYSSLRRINLVAFQVNPYFTMDLVRAAISDFISSIEWINTHLVVPCFGENRLQTSGINTIRARFGSIGLLPGKQF